MTMLSANITDGIIVFDKPQGMTSHDAVGFIRRVTGVRKVGHAGTLDPMAEGVLPICIGKATRMIEFMDAGGQDAKIYDCEMRLGVETDTLDVWGHVVAERGRDDVCGPVKPESVRDALASLTGDVCQVPPAYSAIKYKGKKLYEYARGGEEIPAEALRPRAVHIESIKVTEVTFDAGDVAVGAGDGNAKASVGCVAMPSCAGAGFATVRFTVVCSGGTYVRSIVRDAGNILGSGAAMSALTRTKSGAFTLAGAHTKAEIERAAADGALSKMIFSVDAGIPFMPFVRIGEAECRKFANGVAFRAATKQSVPHGCNAAIVNGSHVRMYCADSFVGIGICDGDTIKPCKVICSRIRHKKPEW
jgi:tRNA pseudouridine55 synthase